MSTATYWPLHKPLDAFFRPTTIAVIGATERPESAGQRIMHNLTTGDFQGTIYPVNLKRRTVFDRRAYRHIGDIDDKIDLAIIVIPARQVLKVVRECVAAGTRAALILSAGFREIGPEGAAREEAIRAAAREGKLRLIGPNSLGIAMPPAGLNATLARSHGHSGSVAFVSQSGALSAAVLDWSLTEKVGFSAFVSIGSMLDVGWGDLIDYLGNDPKTKSIILYLESIGNARAFMSAAREVALTKPIIVMKPGRTEAAAQATASHTGSLTGNDDVLAAAFRRVGVLRVNEIAELFDMAELLAKQPRPSGPNLTIVTNAGGPGALATDALLQSGGRLAPLTADTKRQLNDVLPSHWSGDNPIDILGDASPERYVATVSAVIRDETSHGTLVVLSPQTMTDAEATAEALVAAKANFPRNRPLLASWMGSGQIEAGEQLLNEAGIPTYRYPDTAARMFTYMYRHGRRLRALYETPHLALGDGVDRDGARQLIDEIRAAGRTLMTEIESKRLLSAYNIPVLRTELAATPDEAVAHADAIGYPVVLKLHSETITHKSDAGGVKLYLTSADDVRRAFADIAEAVAAADFHGVTVQPMINLRDGYELIVGAAPDPQFGPVLLFGTGGTLVEVFRDRALGLPPLTSTLARRMMERTRIYAALQGRHGRAPVDMVTLESILVQFSVLVSEHRWIKEIEINPLFAADDRLVALDGRVVLYPADTSPETLPRQAIRPYPMQYVTQWRTRGGLDVTVRPIRPEDEPLLVAFHATLSEQTVYLRYFQSLQLGQRIAHERLTRVAFIDYDREIGLVVTYTHPDSGQTEIIATARLSKSHDFNEAEYAVLVSDNYQRQGLGTMLLRRLVEIGRDEGLDTIYAYMLANNRGMILVSEKLGFEFSTEDGLIKAVLPLNNAAAPA